MTRSLDLEAEAHERHWMPHLVCERLHARLDTAAPTDLLRVMLHHHDPQSRTNWKKVWTL